MNSDERTREILRLRAELLARRSDNDTTRVLLTRAAIVATAGKTYGIPFENLREIVPLPKVTPLPTGQPWILGLAQVHGDLITVLDLDQRLGLSASKPRWLAVLWIHEEALGLAISEIIDFREIYQDEVSRDFARASFADRLISAITVDFIQIVDTDELAARLGQKRK